MRHDGLAHAALPRLLRGLIPGDLGEVLEALLHRFGFACKTRRMVSSERKRNTVRQLALQCSRNELQRTRANFQHRLDAMRQCGLARAALAGDEDGLVLTEGAEALVARLHLTDGIHRV